MTQRPSQRPSFLRWTLPFPSFLLVATVYDRRGKGTDDEGRPALDTANDTDDAHVHPHGLPACAGGRLCHGMRHADYSVRNEQHDKVLVGDLKKFVFLCCIRFFAHT